MQNHSEPQMDRADASLLRVADQSGIRRIATLHRRDSGIHRLPGGEAMATEHRDGVAGVTLELAGELMGMKRSFLTASPRRPTAC